MFGETTRWMAWTFSTAGLQQVADLITTLGDVASVQADIVNDLYHRAGVRAISALVQNLSCNGCLSDEEVWRIGQSWREMQESADSVASVPLSPGSSDFSPSWITALHSFGILSLLPDGNVSFFLHPDLAGQNLYRLMRFDKTACIRHIQQIAMIRGEQVSQPDAKQSYEFQIHPLGERLRASVAGVAREWVRPLGNLRVHLLPTSADFYWAGIHHYSTRPSHGLPFAIFSTTPGLFLPEDRHGRRFFETVLPRPDLAHLSPKNEARDAYFKALVPLARGKPRVYHFELERTRRQYNRTVSALTHDQRGIYDAYAFELLLPILEDPNFGLVRVRRFPSDFDYLTLGNGRSVLLSARHQGRIGHGLWVRPAEHYSVREIGRELRVREAAAGALSALTSYAIAGGSSPPGGELEQIALSLFYAPMIYLLVKSAGWRVKAARRTFEDLRARLRLESDAAELVVLKRVGDTRPVQRIGSIHDLLRDD